MNTQVKKIVDIDEETLKAFEEEYGIQVKMSEFDDMEAMYQKLSNSDIKYDDKGNATYGFYTHRIMQGTIEIPAKTPDGMFEDDFIPNDLGLVVRKINEYYNG